MSRTLWPTALAAAIVIAFAVPTRAQIDPQSRVSPITLAWPLGALATRFAVVAGTTTPHDLGSWAKVDGLDATFDVVDYRSNGGTITLHRAAGSHSLLVQAWLAELAGSFLPSTLTIAQTDYAGTPIVRWSLTGVFPTKWSISSLGDGPGVAIETLILEWRTMEVSCVRCQ
jgi:hypothetical protein